MVKQCSKLDMLSSLTGILLVALLAFAALGSFQIDYGGLP